MLVTTNQTIDSDEREIKSPQDIYNYLDRFVVGQENAKKAIAYAGYIHQLRRLSVVKSSFRSKVETKIEETKQMRNEIKRRLNTHEVGIKGYKTALRSMGSNEELNQTIKTYEYRLEELERFKQEDNDHLIRTTHILGQLKDELAKLPKEIQLGSSSNTMLMGPSGCGKTYMVNKMAEFLKLPFKSIDMTEVTATGWVGRDFNSEIDDYINENLEEKDMEYGIIFLDEVDKICKEAIGKGNTDHNKNTQESLLKALEGKIFTMKGKKVNTANILFVLAGSFAYVEQTLDTISKKNTMGFHGLKSDEALAHDKMKQENLHALLQKHNVATELIGRISIVARLHKLTKEQLRSALLDTENNLITRYTHVLSQDGKDFKLSEEEIDGIIEDCYNTQVGARGLSAAIDRLLMKRLFNDE